MENSVQMLEWWGYLHTDGSYQAKRYFGEQDLKEARESDFVKSIVPPFLAKDLDDALWQIKEKFEANMRSDEIQPTINSIYELKQKLLNREITEILSLKVFSSEGKCIQEARTPNLIVETQEKYFISTSGITPFDNPKYWSFKQPHKRIITATRALGSAKLVIDFKL